MSETDEKPKRDKNKPFPKPAKRKGKVLKVVVSGVLVLASVWVVTYSMQIGKPPWQWGEEDASGFVDYSKEQVAEAKTQLQKVDWGKLGEKTKELWNKTTELEERLEKKMASLAERRKKSSDTKVDSGAGAGAGGDSAKPAAAVEAPPSDLELGCKAMREGCAHYRKGITDQVELKKARAKFEGAAKHFEAAQSGAPEKADRDEASKLLEETQRYLYDCIKLEKVG